MVTYCSYCGRIVNGLVKHCGIPSALALEILQSCTKLSIPRTPQEQPLTAKWSTWLPIRFSESIQMVVWHHQDATTMVTHWQIKRSALQWRYSERNGVSKHQPHECLLNRLFRRRSKETSKLRVTGLCKGNSPVAGDSPAQMASIAENVSIGWRLMEKHFFGWPVAS